MQESSVSASPHEGELLRAVERPSRLVVRGMAIEQLKEILRAVVHERAVTPALRKRPGFFGSNSIPDRCPEPVSANGRVCVFRQKMVPKDVSTAPQLACRLNDPRISIVHPSAHPLHCGGAASRPSRPSAGLTPPSTLALRGNGSSLNDKPQATARHRIKRLNQHSSSMHA